jgi:nucleoside-diphosphate-sugar epimerase
MQIALTGATGFIGTRLCERLLADGHTVRALSRSGRGPQGATLVRGDLGNQASLAALVDEAQCVIHLAAAVRGARAQDFDEPNVLGTERLLDALAARGSTAPLLFFSSLAATQPHLSFYAASKAAAERLVAARRGDLPTLLLRPPAVYGPGDTEMLPVFRFMARTGLAPCAGSAAQRLSLIHVDDLIEVVRAWLPRAATTRATLAVHDGRNGGYDWGELAATVGRACGRKVRVWEIPHVLLDGVARANLLLARLGGSAPMLTPAKLRELRFPSWVCADHTETVLPGWRPLIPLEDGLQRTPGWR